MNFLFFSFEEKFFFDEFRAKTNEDHRVPPIQTIHDRSDRIQSLAFSPHDKYLAAGCLDGSFDLYDVQRKYKNLHFRSSSSISIENFHFKSKENLHRLF